MPLIVRPIPTSQVSKCGGKFRIFELSKCGIRTLLSPFLMVVPVQRGMDLARYIRSIRQVIFLRDFQGFFYLRIHFFFANHCSHFLRCRILKLNQALLSLERSHHTSPRKLPVDCCYKRDKRVSCLLRGKFSVPSPHPNS